MSSRSQQLQQQQHAASPPPPTHGGDHGPNGSTRHYPLSDQNALKGRADFEWPELRSLKPLPPTPPPPAPPQGGPAAAAATPGNTVIGGHNAHHPTSLSSAPSLTGVSLPPPGVALPEPSIHASPAPPPPSSHHHHHHHHHHHRASLPGGSHADGSFRSPGSLQGNQKSAVPISLIDLPLPAAHHPPHTTQNNSSNTGSHPAPKEPPVKPGVIPGPAPAPAGMTSSTARAPHHHGAAGHGPSAGGAASARVAPYNGLSKPMVEFNPHVQHHAAPSQQHQQHGSSAGLAAAAHATARVARFQFHNPSREQRTVHEDQPRHDSTDRRKSQPNPTVSVDTHDTKKGAKGARHVVAEKVRRASTKTSAASAANPKRHARTLSEARMDRAKHTHKVRRPKQRGNSEDESTSGFNTSVEGVAAPDAVQQPPQYHATPYSSVLAEVPSLAQSDPVMVSRRMTTPPVPAARSGGAEAGAAQQQLPKVVRLDALNTTASAGGRDDASEEEHPSEENQLLAAVFKAGITRRRAEAAAAVARREEVRLQRRCVEKALAALQQRPQPHARSGFPGPALSGGSTVPSSPSVGGSSFGDTYRSAASGRSPVNDGLRQIPPSPSSGPVAVPLSVARMSTAFAGPLALLQSALRSKWSSRLVAVRSRSTEVRRIDARRPFALDTVALQQDRVPSVAAEARPPVSQPPTGSKPRRPTLAPTLQKLEGSAVPTEVTTAGLALPLKPSVAMAGRTVGGMTDHPLLPSAAAESLPLSRDANNMSGLVCDRPQRYREDAGASTTTATSSSSTTISDEVDCYESTVQEAYDDDDDMAEEDVAEERDDGAPAGVPPPVSPKLNGAAVAHMIELFDVMYDAEAFKLSDFRTPLRASRRNTLPPDSSSDLVSAAATSAPKALAARADELNATHTRQVPSLLLVEVPAVTGGGAGQGEDDDDVGENSMAMEAEGQSPTQAQMYADINGGLDSTCNGGSPLSHTARSTLSARSPVVHL